MLEQNPYKQILEDDKVKAEFAGFDQTFRVRLFYEKYRMLAKACYPVSWLFNVLSIGSGVLGVASLLAAFIYPDLWLMAVPALLILVLSELTKRFLLRTWIIEKYRDKKTNYGLLIANLVLITGSGFATVYGGIEAVHLARGKTKPTLVNIASIKQNYKAQITAVNLKIKALTDRNTYKGKTYLPPDERKLNASYEADIRQLKTDRKQAVAKADKSNDQTLSVYRSGTNEYMVAFVILSVIVEALCIVTIVFPIYYQHRSRSDKAKLTKAFEPTTLSIDSLLMLLHRAGLSATELIQQLTQILESRQAGVSPVQLPNQVTILAEDRMRIKGFGKLQRSENPDESGQKEPTPATNTDKKPGTPEKPPTPKANLPKRTRGKAVDYERVYQLIDQGGLTSAEIATLCKCSESTVRTAKRERKKGNKLL